MRPKLLVEHETTGRTNAYGPLRLPAESPSASWDPETGRTRSDPPREIPATTGGGCASAPPAAGAWPALAWLGVLLLRRRRR